MEPSAKFYYSYDGKGDVVALVSAANGSIAAHYAYGPFGETIRASALLAAMNPFYFSTKYQDHESDLLYYGFRYYSPNHGQWLNRDPIEESGGLNIRSFANNDPLTFTDHLGLAATPRPPNCAPCTYLGWKHKPQSAEGYMEGIENPAPGIDPDTRETCQVHGCKQGVRYAAIPAKCTVQIWIREDIANPAEYATRTMTLWKHESFHAVHFALYFKSANAIAQQWAKKCIIAPCDKYRLQYVITMILAYSKLQAYQDAYLHWKDYPVEQEAYWKNVYEAYLADYRKTLKEAENVKNELDKCQATH